MATIVSRSPQARTAGGPSARKVIVTILQYALLIFLALIFLLPFYLIVRNGLATETDITSPNWTFFPKQLHFENIQELFSDPEVPFLDGMTNSAIIGVLQTLG